MTLRVGIRGEARVEVTPANTADTFGAGGVRVYATPAMIGLMENACWLAVQPELPEGDTTVGTLVNVRHLAASPVGSHIVAEAELIEIDGRRLVFRVTARDDWRLIGEGIHERAQITLDRFLARLPQLPSES